jgi:hypothetical protein
MTNLSDLASRLGHEPSAPQWRTTSIPPVEPARFGKDHWGALAYVEARTVDHSGTIAHAHMRCHAKRHPVMLTAKGGFLAATGDGSRYPTILADGGTLADHDDYDCLDDLVAAGLLEVHMPRLTADGDCFVDAYDRPVTTPYSDGGDHPIDPGYVTGLAELELAAHATFSLTGLGREVVGRLRQHKAEGGNFASFRWSAGDE